MLDFALVVTFSGVTHVNYFRRHRRYRRGWRAPEARFSRVGGFVSWYLCLQVFDFTSLNAFPAFLRPQSVCEGRITFEICPFCVAKKTKVNCTDVKCTLSSFNLIISQLAEVKLRIKQFYFDIFTKRESNK